jgi:hypothetical protein
MKQEPHALELILEQRGFLTANQLCTLLDEKYPAVRVSYPTLMRYLDKGYLKFIKVGGQHRVERRSILHYLKFGTQGLPLPDIDDDVGEPDPLEAEVIKDPKSPTTIDVPIKENPHDKSN